MKIIYTTFVAILLLPVLSTYAQNAPENAEYGKCPVEYQWPRNGDNDVPATTTFILRPTKAFMAGRTSKDFIFTVHGEFSGNHAGKILISGDNQTIIFKPSQPFGRNEAVNVKFEISGSENIQPVSFSFHTTPMSKQEQGQALYALMQKEQAEIESAQEESDHSPLTTLPLLNDTIAFSPAIVTIDTLTDAVSTNNEGNLFIAPTSKIPSPYSFIAVTSDTAAQALPGDNSFLFERDIPDGTGNFRMQPDGTLTYFRQFAGKSGAPTGGVFDGQYEHLDQHMHIIDTFQCVGFTVDMHDFQILFNKRSLLIAYPPRKVAMKVYLDSVANGAYRSLVPQAKDTAIVFDAVIQELDENKNLVFQWRSQDHFQITDATRDIHLVPANPSDTLIDYMHINTIIRDPNDGNFIASFRHCDEISKIDSTGAFIWRWGGKHNQFTFLGDTLKFSHQHDPERISPSGHIIMFDNGNLHTVDTIIKGKDTVLTVPSTRAIEYNLDEANHTATVVWQYKNLPFCAAAGNVQRFADGNTLIDLGSTNQPTVLELNSQDQRIFRMTIANAFSYRAYRFPFTPLDAVRQTGTVSTSGIAGIYPNPAQNSATVNFSAAAAGIVQIDLLDILGHRVFTLSQRLSGEGTYSADLDVHNLPAGTYYCKVSQNSNVTMRILVVQK